MAPVLFKFESAWLLIACVVLADSLTLWEFFNYVVPIAILLCLCREPPIFGQLLPVGWALSEMETKAVALATAIRNGHTPMAPILNRLGELKTEIKHRQVPDGAIAPLFGLVGDSITRFDYVEAGLSILGHLTKRLVLQEQKELLVFQTLRILPSIIECFGDQRDRIRQRAIQALSDAWQLSSTNVEQVIRDVALTSERPVVKEAGMRWILKVSSLLQDLDTANLLQTKKDHDMQFKLFVPRIIDCLLDVDGSVRETAKAIIVGLFQ